MREGTGFFFKDVDPISRAVPALLNVDQVHMVIFKWDSKVYLLATMEELVEISSPLIPPLKNAFLSLSLVQRLGLQTGDGMI